ncbi:MAG: YggS family pyridoxal phosphate-dependent enzyme [Candidatus Diapherotrites archaeon]
MLGENLSAIREGIAEACKKAGRNPEEVKLVAVTKNRSIGKINELISLGVRDLGENKLQELLGKVDSVEGVNWHFVGHLQSNKARKAVENCEWIHSVDSLKLAAKIDSAASEIGKRQKILLEVNVSGEKSKYGLEPEKLGDVVGEIKKMRNLDLQGFMAMAPLVGAEETRRYFSALKELGEKFNLPELSMGMSNDFAVAVEEGATMVRIGTSLFE